MEGVIVQVGEPKSIVLFNNGKISAIPTPEGCRVGMVVTVKPNTRLKILLITISAVVVLAVGITIGILVSRSNKTGTTIESSTRDDGYDWQRGQEKRQELQRSWEDKASGN